MNRIEILAPAGDEQTARAALGCGADAVYLGLNRFSARDSAENFDFAALGRIADLAHVLSAKVYVCLNTLVKERELEEFFASARGAWEHGADAVLIQDIFLGRALKERYPQITLHLSTQAGCCNVYGAQMAKDFGFSRVVLARETPLREIAKISGIVETEAFVQGALCTCFSGQCYLSSFAGNHSGNRGKCKQPCRKRYSIDRRGYEELAYALSLSDLSVGREIGEYANAGVSSFKIEGRLRRPEYVAAAVGYYRALLTGKSGERELSDLKRAYNRGDYTKGLAFGQSGLLSRAVQGHIGERIGTVEEGGFVRGSARKEDGFKILREGKEVGGAVFRAAGEGGFYLSSRERLQAGDEVRITTDSTLPKRVFREKKREIPLSLRFVAGERAKIVSNGFVFEGEAPEPAKSSPLTRDDLVACFLKTDGLPFAPRFEQVETQNAFLPRSALNAVRREFYAALLRHFSPARAPLPAAELPPAPPPQRNNRTAAIFGGDKSPSADLLIYKPRDYAKIKEELKTGTGKLLLYLPPFWTERDEALVKDVLPLFEGIYCDGYYGLWFAKKYGLRFFAGTGFNLSNSVSVAEVKKAGADWFALSKELSLSEQDALSQRDAFALSSGAVKVMDLIYCPFEKTCRACDRRENYLLTDEEGRRFPLRRYRAEDCRFELYNCAPLSGGEGNAGKLSDLSVALSAPPTKGHFERSML